MLNRSAEGTAASSREAAFGNSSEAKQMATDALRYSKGHLSGADGSAADTGTVASRRKSRVFTERVGRKPPRRGIGGSLAQRVFTLSIYKGPDAHDRYPRSACAGRVSRSDDRA